LLPIVAVAAVAACSAKQNAPGVSVAQASGADSAHAIAAAHALLGPEAKAALERGNDAFRKKAYAAALAEYRAASALAPQHSAPLFGVYMVARATNDTVMANSALVGIRQRGGAMPAAEPHPATPPVASPHAAIPQKKAGT
jgi:hypothetical protein